MIVQDGIDPQALQTAEAECNSAVAAAENAWAGVKDSKHVGSETAQAYALESIAHSLAAIATLATAICRMVSEAHTEVSYRDGE